MESQAFRLGDWLVEPALDRLTRNGTVVHVRPQAMDVLVFLAAHAGGVVSHDETMAAVWGERFVNEYALTRCIADLRKALGEDARHTQYIENIPKRGYRLIVPVVHVDGQPAPDAAPAVTPPAPDAAPSGILPAPDAAPSGAPAAPSPAPAPTLVAPATVAADTGPLTDARRAAPPPRRLRAIAVTVALVACGGALAALAGRFASVPAEPVTVSQLDLAPAPCLPTTTSGTPGGGRTALAFTPDGRSLLFLGCAGTSTAVYHRRLDRAAAEAIAGTAGAQALAVAPDGRAVAFWAAGEIRTAPLERGPVTRVCATGSATPPFGLAWGDDGRIVYAAELGGLWQVPAGGGRPAALTTPRDGEVSHRLPHVLPGSRAVVFTVRRSAVAWTREEIVLQRLDGVERVRLLDRGADARYAATGHLLFMDLGSIAAVPFDLASLSVTGPPVTLLDHVAQALNEEAPGEDTGAGQFALSGAGDLAYLSREGGTSPSARRGLAWMDRRGRLTPLPVETRGYAHLRLSPDGARLAAIVRDLASVDAWTYDLRRAAWSPLTEDGDIRGLAWSPDGSALALANGAGVLLHPARPGTAVRDVVPARGAYLVPSSWSRLDQLALLRGPDARRLDIVMVGLGDPPGDPSSSRYATTPFATQRASEAFAEFSPDGRWVAYVSDESGRDEVYVRPAGGDGAPVQVSAGGGANPLWRRDGREIVYATRRGGGAGAWLEASAVTARDGTLRAARARPLCPLPDVRLGEAANDWDVTPDGTRFLVLHPVPREALPAPGHVELVQHASALLQR